MPTGHRKLEKLSELIGKLWKSYREIYTGLQSRHILAVQQYDATNGLPSVKDSKRKTTKLSSSSASKCTPALFVLMLCSALGAEEFFHAAKTFGAQTNANHEKKYDEILFLIDGRHFRSFEDFRLLLNVKS